jgi:tetratricopeptide (TPR) repeat protein
MRTLILILLISLSSSLFAKEDMNTYWQQANKAYEQKDYANAITKYQKIADTKPNNAVVYFNLGNTYYKLNNISQAILNYERAVAINPDYTEAEDNLIIAQSRIPNRLAQAQDIFFIRWWKAITASTHSALWAVLAVLLFLTLIGINIVKKLRLASFTIQRQFFAAGWSALAVMLVFAFTSANRASHNNKAVVTQNDSPFYTSPQQTKPSLYVPEGTTVVLDNEIQGWVSVTLPDGREGWIRTNTLTKI